MCRGKGRRGVGLIVCDGRKRRGKEQSCLSAAQVLGLSGFVAVFGSDINQSDFYL